MKFTSPYTHDFLNRSPKPGHWSVNQVIRHLILSEQHSIDYVKKKWGFNPDLRKADLLTHLRYRVLWFSMWQPFHLNAPRVVNIKEGEFDISEQMGIWKKQREELYDFLNELPPEAFGREFFKHPVMGKIKLSHMLGFFYHHCKRHIRQIKKAILYLR